MNQVLLTENDWLWSSTRRRRRRKSQSMPSGWRKAPQFDISWELENRHVQLRESHRLQLGSWFHINIVQLVLKVLVVVGRLGTDVIRSPEFSRWGSKQFSHEAGGAWFHHFGWDPVEPPRNGDWWTTRGNHVPNCQNGAGWALQRHGLHLTKTCSTKGGETSQSSKHLGWAENRC